MHGSYDSETRTCSTCRSPLRCNEASSNGARHPACQTVLARRRHNLQVSDASARLRMWPMLTMPCVPSLAAPAQARRSTLALYRLRRLSMESSMNQSSWNADAVPATQRSRRRASAHGHRVGHLSPATRSQLLLCDGTAPLAASASHTSAAAADARVPSPRMATSRTTANRSTRTRRRILYSRHGVSDESSVQEASTATPVVAEASDQDAGCGGGMQNGNGNGNGAGDCSQQSSRWWTSHHPSSSFSASAGAWDGGNDGQRDANVSAQTNRDASMTQQPEDALSPVVAEGSSSLNHSGAAAVSSPHLQLSSQSPVAVGGSESAMLPPRGSRDDVEPSPRQEARMSPASPAGQGTAGPPCSVSSVCTASPGIVDNAVSMDCSLPSQGSLVYSDSSMSQLVGRGGIDLTPSSDASSLDDIGGLPQFPGHDEGGLDSSLESWESRTVNTRRSSSLFRCVCVCVCVCVCGSRCCTCVRPVSGTYQICVCLQPPSVQAEAVVHATTKPVRVQQEAQFVRACDSAVATS